MIRLNSKQDKIRGRCFDAAIIDEWSSFITNPIDTETRQEALYRETINDLSKRLEVLEKYVKENVPIKSEFIIIPTKEEVANFYKGK